MYEYKVISSTIVTDKNETFEAAMEKLFNLEDQAGWEFYTSITNTEVIPPGCLATFLFGKSAASTTRTHQSFIFRRKRTLKP